MQHTIACQVGYHIRLHAQTGQGPFHATIQTNHLLCSRCYVPLYSTTITCYLKHTYHMCVRKDACN